MPGQSLNRVRSPRGRGRTDRRRVWGIPRFRPHFCISSVCPGTTGISGDRAGCISFRISSGSPHFFEPSQLMKRRDRSDAYLYERSGKAKVRHQARGRGGTARTETKTGTDRRRGACPAQQSRHGVGPYTRLSLGAARERGLRAVGTDRPGPVLHNGRRRAPTARVFRERARSGQDRKREEARRSHHA
jgi:hypothetical protein